MGADSDDADDDSEVTTLVQGFRCPVCWEYFNRPHTLQCGHTFCTRCLMTLARLARCSRNRPVDRVRVKCPSCRKNSIAGPLLRRKAAVNYVIKELMDEWFKSPYATGKIESISLRTIAAQTDSKKDKDKSHPNDTTDENDTSDDISETIIHDVIIHKLKPKVDEERPNKLKEPLDLSIRRRFDNEDGTSAAADDNTMDTVESSSSDESLSEPEIGALFDQLNVVNENEVVPVRLNVYRDYFRRLQFILMLFYTRCMLTFQAIRQSRSRLALTIFWFVYGAIIVCISRSFLPWMSLYTVVYFVIIYAELEPID